MILGIGNDIVDIARIKDMYETHGVRFEDRVFSDTEKELARSRKEAGHHINTYAKRYAAKEACAKAMRTGFVDGIFLRDISVEIDDLGAPFLILSGGALKKLDALTPANHTAHIHLSMSDEPPMAQAFVIIEAIPNSVSN